MEGAYDTADEVANRDEACGALLQKGQVALVLREPRARRFARPYNQHTRVVD